tara:strand:- start:100 stop:555 length:456 start_codon:yes stop_codon:yes gene_type:complete
MNSKRASILKNKYVTYTQSDTNIKFRIVVRSVIFFCTWLFISVASSNDLSGVWKHSERTIWIEITTEKGTGIIVRNDRFPHRVGRTFMTDIKANKYRPNVWYGLAYIEKLKDFKKVEISLAEADKMLITGNMGFLSRTVEWTGFDKLPALH